MRSFILILVLVNLISKDEGQILTLNGNDQWKLREREEMFWLFHDGQFTNHQELPQRQMNLELRLEFVAFIYEIPLEEIKNWQRHEVLNFESVVKQYRTDKWDINDWQMREEGRIDWLIHQNRITHEDLERWLNENFHKFNQQAQEYYISTDDLIAFYHQEIDRLFQLQKTSTLAPQPKPKDEELFLKTELERIQKLIHDQQEEFKVTSKWQQSEIKRFEDIITHQNSTIVELQQKMKNWNETQQLCSQYNVRLEKIEELIKRHFQLSENEEKLKEKDPNACKKSDSERLIPLSQRLSEFNAQLSSDREPLENLAKQYNISVPDIEKLINKEVKDLGVIVDLNDWQKLERSKIHDMLQQSNITIEHFQDELNKNFIRVQNLALQYHTTPSEVEQWILSEVKLQIESKESWQTNETSRLDNNLIQSPNINLDDLEISIEDDRNRTSQVVVKYEAEDEKKDISEGLHIQVPEQKSENKDTFESEQNMIFYSENLTDWQKSERQYLYKIITDQNISTEDFKLILNSNRDVLKELAEQYNITMDELINWQYKELDHLAYLSYGKPIQSDSLKKIEDNHNELISSDQRDQPKPQVYYEIEDSEPESDSLKKIEDNHNELISSDQRDQPKPQVYHEIEDLEPELGNPTDTMPPNVSQL